jgi:2-amino-5-formylamino-6-ribosylaminopyrimidin-4(3H)-one 5'-monophosphate deformylase
MSVTISGTLRYDGDNMAELRYRAGKIRDPGVHKVGIIALGSHLENHGPALPIDTDAKIGAHIAFQSSLITGAKFLGIIFPAYELDTIDHGVHVSLEELKENVISTLNNAKRFLNIEKVVIVNAHGGNIPLVAELWDIEDKTDLSITFNNKVISSEGPHGGSGELSMAKVLGIIDEEEVVNQANVDEYEEVGLHGFKQAREDDPNIEEGALDVEENGVYVDEEYGERLFNLAINSVIFDVEKLLDF